MSTYEPSSEHTGYLEGVWRAGFVAHSADGQIARFPFGRNLHCRGNLASHAQDSLDKCWRQVLDLPRAPGNARNRDGRPFRHGEEATSCPRLLPVPRQPPHPQIIAPEPGVSPGDRLADNDVAPQKSDRGAQQHERERCSDTCLGQADDRHPARHRVCSLLNVLLASGCKVDIHRRQ